MALDMIQLSSTSTVPPIAAQGDAAPYRGAVGAFRRSKRFFATRSVNSGLSNCNRTWNPGAGRFKRSVPPSKTGRNFLGLKTLKSPNSPKPC